jgi:hypothetical protein
LPALDPDATRVKAGVNESAAWLPLMLLIDMNILDGC